MNLSLEIGMLSSLFAALAITGTALIGRKAARKAADAAMHAALTDEREAISADWDRYTGRLQEWAGSLHRRVGELECRVGDAEKKADVAEVRAARAERMYEVAVDYLRRVSVWVAERLPGDELPPPPVELGDVL